ncbi:methyltransferase domain-containing protein [Micromonospora schwarzwaldensis]|uniref:methyltransferase domain-containing protein n=1 Tax=Micromonospora sp. DSM 45708 TaxID=3111767 RepID=UPI0031DEC55D
MIREDQYFLGYRSAEHERLQAQAEDFHSEAAWLFDQVGPLDGKNVVELGVGPRGCLDELARRVGPTGTVIGVERDAESVELARKFVVDRTLDNVDVRQGDARATGLPGDSFDLVTERLILHNVPRPEEIVAEAVRLARPGGWVAFHEGDRVGQVCDPPAESWSRLMAVSQQYADRNNINLFVGRRMPNLLRRAGLVDVQVRPVVYIDHEPGHERRMVLADFAENLRDRLISSELITREEFDELHSALSSHLADPGTTVISHLYVQAWGRKPE